MNQAEKAILNETPRLVYGREELEDKDALLLTFFGDGFTEKEQELFFAEAKRMAKYMMATSPWDEYADAVKIYAIGVCSNESGVRADRGRGRCRHAGQLFPRVLLDLRHAAPRGNRRGGQGKDP